MDKRYNFIFNFVLIALLAISMQAFAADVVPKLKEVSVQLKWFHQFQFAGFYAAIEQGYFTEAGLNVILIEGGPTIKVTESVTSGKAEFGIGNSSLLIDYNNGSKIVAVATLFQHSPSIILARRDETIRTVKDLEGRTIMGKLYTAELMTYLKVAGVDLKKLN
ncbi:ABC transporter substrate-binding protein [Colwellia sp. MB02u-14]|uniref:ABC transporter substrate-binding protein n=1 Tax=Colwellia sp. MB02u-14 TaxID=2759815 RepID=UPI0015F6BF63|nr:ABC transporter substrate-binding protein [Colwellia sp. MB02u-14]MBA6302729.1 ABC transporter substrate-binding protein [Colwellia sp. MB02u-14]